MATPSGAAVDEVRVIHEGKALEVLLDLAEIFGAVSLFDAAMSMTDISNFVPEAFVAVALLWSFFAISILHTIGSSLEVFEGEYQKNWAVLGLNWTVNFNGLLLFVTSQTTFTSSLPWMSMVAPAVQTIVLAYALSKVAGRQRRVQMGLITVNVFLGVGVAVSTHTNGEIEGLCSDMSLRKVDQAVGEGFIAYIPGDCFDLGKLFNNSVIAVVSSTDGHQFFNSSTCFEGMCTASTNQTTTWFVLTNHDLIGYFLSALGTAAVSLAAISVLVLGGSFAKIIVESRSFTDNELSSAQKTLVVCGWVVAYPIYESCRLGVRLFEWYKCLKSSLKQGKYEFGPDGKILLSDE